MERIIERVTAQVTEIVNNHIDDINDAVEFDTASYKLWREVINPRISRIRESAIFTTEEKAELIRAMYDKASQMLREKREKLVEKLRNEFNI